MLLTTIEADGDVLRLLGFRTRPLSSLRRAPEQPEPAAVTSLTAPDRSYAPWSSLLPRNWLPLIELADGKFALGAATFGQDALGLHQYALAATYEFTQNELTGDLAYLYDGRHGLLVDRSMVVKETDGTDEIAAYEISEGVQWVSTWRHLALNRRIYWGLGGALEREQLRLAGNYRHRSERACAGSGGRNRHPAPVLDVGGSEHRPAAAPVRRDLARPARRVFGRRLSRRYARALSGSPHRALAALERGLG